MKKIIFFIMVTFVSFLFCACEQNEISNQDNSRPSTQRMVDTLRYIAENIDPTRNYYANHLRADDFKNKMATATPREGGVLFYSWMKELINSSDNKEAIVNLSTMIQVQGLDINSITKSTKLLFELLALAYLREGELNNCLANHSAESCILPLTGGGLHTIKEGSMEAIKIYEKILPQFPEDLNSRWLLNVAYMTLGEYPSKVPAKWLIPGLKPDTKSPVLPFENVTMGMGIDINGLSGGVCLDDFNNDGFIDIMASSYGLSDQIRFFISNQDGTYQEKTMEAGLEGILGGLNMIHADYNNDGYLDVFVLRGAWLGSSGRHPNSLLKNNGDGTFTDVTYDVGLLSFYPTQSATWSDFNNDGWIDLFIVSETEPTTKGEHPCELYLNQQDGTFQNRIATSGINVEGFFKGVTSGDINNDGWADIYISNLDGQNYLFLNKSSANSDQVSFEDISISAQVHQPRYGFPTWMWDYDNDGWLDIFASSYDHRHMQKVGEDEAIQMLNIKGDVIYPKLYKNNHDKTFSDVTEEVGLNRVMFPMGSNFGDLDNDGFQDFYLGTGAPDLRSVVPNLMFYNHGGKKFEDITYLTGTAHVQKGHAVGFADLDNDGDQDIYTVMGGAYSGDIFHNVLFENSNNQNAWITLKLEGTTTNKAAIGSKIKITVSNIEGLQKVFYNIVSSGGSFGASSLQQEIGLHDAVQIDEIEITWANKNQSIEKFTKIELNKRYSVQEGSGALVPMNQPIVKFKPSTDHEHMHH